MNARSSRPHVILTLSIEVKPKPNSKAVTVFKFHLVDLAESERQKKTKAKGERLKEASSQKNKYLPHLSSRYFLVFSS